MGKFRQWYYQLRCWFDGGHIFTLAGNCIYCGKHIEIKKGAAK